MKPLSEKDIELQNAPDIIFKIVDFIRVKGEWQGSATELLQILNDITIKPQLLTKKLIKSTITIPCTKCRYCVDGCPQGINIPRFFELVNEANRYSVDNFKWHYKEELKKGGNPAECVECHACEGHCPQKIQIVDELKKLRAMFE